MHGYFRTLCVGYGLYAVGNTVMLILLYFTDYKGAVLASGLFAGVAGLATAVSLLLPQQFYGFGFLLGAAVFFIVALLVARYLYRQLAVSYPEPAAHCGDRQDGLVYRTWPGARPC